MVILKNSAVVMTLEEYENMDEHYEDDWWPWDLVVEALDESADILSLR